MLTQERIEQLNQRLLEIGIDRMLADESTGFTTHFGGTPEERQYAGQWLTKALATRTNTTRMLAEGKPALRVAVMAAIYKITGGEYNTGIWWLDLADEMNLEREVLSNALDYLENEGLVEEGPIGVYNLTHLGVKRMEGGNQPFDQSITPSVHVNNNYGNQVLAHGNHNQITQINYSQLPTELGELAESLRNADGGTISPECETLVKVLEQGGSQLKIASAAEDIATKSGRHLEILNKFKDELVKKIAEKSIDGGLKVGEWIYNHGPAIIAALDVWKQHHGG